MLPSPAAICSGGALTARRKRYALARRGGARASKRVVGGQSSVTSGDHRRRELWSRRRPAGLVGARTTRYGHCPVPSRTPWQEAETTGAMSYEKTACQCAGRAISGRCRREPRGAGGPSRSGSPSRFGAPQTTGGPSSSTSGAATPLSYFKGTQGRHADAAFGRSRRSAGSGGRTGALGCARALEPGPDLTKRLSTIRAKAKENEEERGPRRFSSPWAMGESGRRRQDKA